MKLPCISEVFPETGKYIPEKGKILITVIVGRKKSATSKMKKNQKRCCM
jgi:hypothetical protein